MKAKEGNDNYEICTSCYENNASGIFEKKEMKKNNKKNRKKNENKKKKKTRKCKE